MEIKVIISASTELLSVLTTIAQGLSGNKVPSTNGVEVKPAAEKEGTKLKHVVEPAAVNNSANKKPKDTEDNGVEAVSIETVRAEVNKQKEAGKREKIKALLTEFSVDKVTSLDVKQYSEFLEKLKAI